MAKFSIIPIIANSVLNSGCRITPIFVGANGLESLRFFFVVALFAFALHYNLPLRPSNLKRAHFLALFFFFFFKMTDSQHNDFLIIIVK